MSKQDRQGVRTPSQLEQKYNFDGFTGASQTAEAARVFAGEANETAKLAKAQAEEAKSTAESASQTAEEAKSAISGVATSAANADAKATSALEKAESVTVLATPNLIMGGEDIVPLSLSTPKGIVLVWSAYTEEDGNIVPSDSDLHYTFVPKTEIGKVCTGLMVSEYAAYVGYKTVTISADSITGNNVNTNDDEQYKNAHWVLCRVLGV